MSVGVTRRAWPLAHHLGMNSSVVCAALMLGCWYLLVGMSKKSYRPAKQWVCLVTMSTALFVRCVGHHEPSVT